MRNATRVFGLGVVFSLILSTAALACHDSNYWIEIFTKIRKQKLDKDQITAIWDLKKNYDRQKTMDHQKGLSCAAHETHVPEFVAACAGVLDDEQFKAATGKDKTEVQKLRYEVNQLKKEVAEIKKILGELKK